MRNGFVSNSSSSSFIIGTRGKLDKKKLIKLFKVDKESPIFLLVKGMADILVENATKMTLKEYLEDTCYEEDGVPKIVKKIISKGFTLYSGSVGDEAGGLESALCQVGLDYEDDEFIIEKEEGY